MIQAIRNSLSNRSHATLGSRVVRAVVRIVLGLYFIVFLADSLNIDVLAASLKSKVIFVDDSAITDSFFDSGTSHGSAFEAPSAFNHSLHFVKHSSSFDADELAFRNAIYEDEDSPGIEDGQTSTQFSTLVIIPRPLSDRTESDAPPHIDRVVVFQQFLI